MGWRIGFLLMFFLMNACKESISLQPTVIDTHNYSQDFTTFTRDNRINIVIEIPAGTDQKWEVNKDSGHLEWERIHKDSLRIIKFLPYPANYGFIPQTHLPASAGGDGDPLDVFLLGPAIERGTVVPGRVIGIIRMLDNGEQDDKLIAVSDESHFGKIKSLHELKTNYPGVLEVLTSWLRHYKGNDSMEIQSVEDEKSALDVLVRATEYYLQEQ
tara:strand:+ start:86339 stop:86980 length:642 start_codon:yes stop_codon:yes gene_type:complete